MKPLRQACADMRIMLTAPPGDLLPNSHLNPAEQTAQHNKLTASFKSCLATVQCAGQPGKAHRWPLSRSAQKVKKFQRNTLGYGAASQPSGTSAAVAMPSNSADWATLANQKRNECQLPISIHSHWKHYPIELNTTDGTLITRVVYLVSRVSARSQLKVQVFDESSFYAYLDLNFNMLTPASKASAARTTFCCVSVKNRQFWVGLIGPIFHYRPTLPELLSIVLLASVKAQLGRKQSGHKRSTVFERLRFSLTSGPERTKRLNMAILILLDYHESLMEFIMQRAEASSYPATFDHLGYFGMKLLLMVVTGATLRIKDPLTLHFKTLIDVYSRKDIIKHLVKNQRLNSELGAQMRGLVEVMCFRFPPVCSWMLCNC